MGKFSPFIGTDAPANDSPLAAGIQSMQSEQETALCATLLDARKKNPDAFANAARLADQTGLPTGTVERNLPVIEGRAANDKIDFGALMKDTPVTAEHLQDPAVAGAAHMMISKT